MGLLAMASSPAWASGDASLAAVELDKVQVRAQREAPLRAVDLKRSADAIQDVVSSDAMGVYPDMNVAESLQRLPGISVTRDQGEGPPPALRCPGVPMPVCSHRCWSWHLKVTHRLLPQHVASPPARRCCAAKPELPITTMPGSRV